MAKTAAVRNYTKNRARPNRDPEPSAAPTDPADEQELLRQAVEGYVNKLDRLATEQVGKKVLIEDRWFEDVRRYFARYDSKTESNLKNENKSRVFVSWTRNKTHQWEARLCDMLFPTDDKNWGIQPTPVPELVAAAQGSAFNARRMTEQANLEMKLGNQQKAVDLANQAQPHAEDAMRKQGIMDEAKKRADAMQAEIDDQLTQARYNIKARDAIHDACLLGTGIMKGPLAAAPEKMRRPWKQRVDPATGQTTNVYELAAQSQQVGVDWQRTDPWNFFPDMNAMRPEDWQFTFERHLYGDKEMRRLARIPGFNAKVIAELIVAGARTPVPSYINELREITGQQSQGSDPMFQVWEYHGPMEASELVNVAKFYGDNELKTALEQKAEEDALKEYQVICWFCEGRLIAFGPHPLESGESLYSLFNFQRDESSVFGFGIPYLMQNSQAALNGAWRMVLDNGTFAAGPQIIVDRHQIEPANKNWNVRGPKLWYVKETFDPNRGEPMRIVQITNQQDRLERIIAHAIKFADEEASMPLIAQGEQASHITPTAQGMSMLMNSANVTFRHVVRNFDDNMTVPNIRRSYDWNMQNSLKDYIKGDYQVDARGSSVLLVREMQATNLSTMLINACKDPILQSMTKIPNLYRRMVQAHQIPADEVVKSDDELQADADKAASQPQQPDPEVLKLQVQKELAQLESDTRIKVAETNRDTAMIQLAEKKNMDLMKIRAMFAVTKMTTDSKERGQAVEVAMTARRDKEAKSKGEPLPSTGGGSI